MTPYTTWDFVQDMFAAIGLSVVLLALQLGGAWLIAKFLQGSTTHQRVKR